MKRRTKPKTPRVVERPLVETYEALGLCWPNGTIHIDPRQGSRKYLDTMIREHLHFCFPRLSERRVIWAAGVIAGALWKQQFRRLAK